MRVVVGAPVRRREWAAETWMDHVAWATVDAGIKDDAVDLVFVSHPEDPTNALLKQSADLYGFRTHFIDDIEKPSHLKRSWGPARLHTMVRVRNLLLEKVRELEPDLFLSLDSDIMLQKSALRSMARLLASGGKPNCRPSATSHCVFLDQLSTHFPNFAMLTSNGQMKRDYVGGDLCNVHVIMAAKLMTPDAYHVDYEYDARGEDIGWSLAVRRAGMHLGWTGKVISKHCMEPEDLYRVDRRVGY